MSDKDLNNLFYGSDNSKNDSRKATEDNNEIQVGSEPTPLETNDTLPIPEKQKDTESQSYASKTLSQSPERSKTLCRSKNNKKYPESKRCRSPKSHSYKRRQRSKSPRRKRHSSSRSTSPGFLPRKNRETKTRSRSNDRRICRSRRRSNNYRQLIRSRSRSPEQPNSSSNFLLSRSTNFAQAAYKFLEDTLVPIAIQDPEPLSISTVSPQEAVNLPVSTSRINQNVVFEPSEAYTNPAPPDNEHFLTEKSKNGTSKIILITLPIKYTKDQLQCELLRIEIVAKDIKVVNKFFYIEFCQEIDAISFMRKTRGMFLSSSPNMQYFMSIQLTDDISKFIIVPNHSSQSELQSSQTIFLATVSMACCSASNVLHGKVCSPYRISVFSNGGSVSSYVAPLAFMRKREICMFKNAGLKLDGKDIILKNGIRVQEEGGLHQEFLDKFFRIFIENLKIYGSSNCYDKAIMQFASWEDAHIFLEWIRLTDRFELFQNTISGICISPARNLSKHYESLGGSPLEVDTTDCHEQSRLLYAVTDLVIQQDVSFLTNNLVPSSKEITSLLKEPFPVTNEDQNICAISLEFIQTENTLSLTQIGVCLSNRHETKNSLFVILPSDASKEQINSLGLRHEIDKETNLQVLQVNQPTKYSLNDNEKVKFIATTELKGLQDFLQFVNEFKTTFPYPVTLLAYSNHVTLPVLLRSIKRNGIEKEFYETFSSFTDVFALLNGMGRISSNNIPNFSDVADKFNLSLVNNGYLPAHEIACILMKICKTALPVDKVFNAITNYSLSISQLFLKKQRLIPYLVKTDKKLTIQPEEIITISVPIDEDLLNESAYSRKNLRVSYRQDLPLKITGFDVEIDNKQISMRVCNQGASSIMIGKSIDMAVISLAPEMFTIPIELSHIKYSTKTKFSSIDEITFDKMNYTLKTDFSVDIVKKELDVITIDEEDQMENDNHQDKNNCLPSKTKISLVPLEMLCKNKKIMNPTHNGNIFPILIYVYIEVVQSEIIEVEALLTSENALSDSITFMRHIAPDKMTPEELTNLGYHRDGNKWKVNSRVENSIEFEAVPRKEAFDDFMNLINKNISVNQECFLITMCPETMNVFRNWCSKCNTAMDFDKIFLKWTSMASLMSSQQETNLIRAYSFKKNRINIYFENVSNSPKSKFMKNSKAMREIYEQLIVNDQDFFPTKLPSSIYLPVFFHIDFVYNDEDGCPRIATIGYHTANQQRFFTVVKLDKISELAKSFGYSSPSSFMRSDSTHGMDCKQEKDAILGFLNSLKRDCRASNCTSAVLVTMTPNNTFPLFMESLKKYSLIEEGRIIQGVGNVADYWSEKMSKDIEMADFENFCRYNLNRPDVNFKHMNADIKMKNIFDVTCHLIQALPNYENFLKEFVHPIPSPYVNKILLSIPEFSEDVYKVVANTNYFLPMNKAIKITAKVLGCENLCIDSRLLLYWSKQLKGVSFLTSPQICILPLSKIVEVTIIRRSSDSFSKLTKGTIISTAKLLLPEKPEVFESCPKIVTIRTESSINANQITKTVYIEESILLKANQQIKVSIAVCEAKTETDVDVYLSYSYEDDKPDDTEPKEWVFDYDSKQNTKNGIITFGIQNLTRKDIRIARGKKIGKVLYAIPIEKTSQEAREAQAESDKFEENCKLANQNIPEKDTIQEKDSSSLQIRNVDVPMENEDLPNVANTSLLQSHYSTNSQSSVKAKESCKDIDQSVLNIIQRFPQFEKFARNYVGRMKILKQPINPTIIEDCIYDMESMDLVNSDDILELLEPHWSIDISMEKCLIILKNKYSLVEAGLVETIQEIINVLMFDLSKKFKEQQSSDSPEKVVNEQEYEEIDENECKYNNKNHGKTKDDIKEMPLVNNPQHIRNIFDSESEVESESDEDSSNLFCHICQVEGHKTDACTTCTLCQAKGHIFLQCPNQDSIENIKSNASEKPRYGRDEEKKDINSVQEEEKKYNTMPENDEIEILQEIKKEKHTSTKIEEIEIVNSYFSNSINDTNKDIDVISIEDSDDDNDISVEIAKYEKDSNVSEQTQNYCQEKSEFYRLQQHTSDLEVEDKNRDKSVDTYNKTEISLGACVKEEKIKDIAVNVEIKIERDENYCTLCQDYGHNDKNEDCPERSRPIMCLRCKQIGHIRAECKNEEKEENNGNDIDEEINKVCPTKQEPIRSLRYSRKGSIQDDCSNLVQDFCYLCQEYGHKYEDKDCPTKLKPIKCLICKQEGHFRADCQFKENNENMGDILINKGYSCPKKSEPNRHIQIDFPNANDYDGRCLEEKTKRSHLENNTDMIIKSGNKECSEISAVKERNLVLRENDENWTCEPHLMSIDSCQLDQNIGSEEKDDKSDKEIASSNQGTVRTKESGLENFSNKEKIDRRCSNERIPNVTFSKEVVENVSHVQSKVQKQFKRKHEEPSLPDLDLNRLHLGIVIMKFKGTAILKTLITSKQTVNVVLNELHLSVKVNLKDEVLLEYEKKNAIIEDVSYEFIATKALPLNSWGQNRNYFTGFILGHEKDDIHIGFDKNGVIEKAFMKKCSIIKSQRESSVVNGQKIKLIIMPIFNDPATYSFKAIFGIIQNESQGFVGLCDFPPFSATFLCYLRVFKKLLEDYLGTEVFFVNINNDKGTTSESILINGNNGPQVTKAIDEITSILTCHRKIGNTSNEKSKSTFFTANFLKHSNLIFDLNQERRLLHFDFIQSFTGTSITASDCKITVKGPIKELVNIAIQKILQTNNNTAHPAYSWGVAPIEIIRMKDSNDLRSEVLDKMPEAQSRNTNSTTIPLNEENNCLTNVENSSEIRNNTTNVGVTHGQEKLENHVDDKAKKSLEDYALRQKLKIEYFWIAPKGYVFPLSGAKQGNYQVRLTVGTFSADGDYTNWPNETINSAANKLLEKIAKESVKTTQITRLEIGDKKASVQSISACEESSMKYQKPDSCTLRNTESDLFNDQFPSPCPTTPEKEMRLSKLQNAELKTSKYSTAMDPYKQNNSLTNILLDMMTKLNDGDLQTKDKCSVPTEGIKEAAPISNLDMEDVKPSTLFGSACEDSCLNYQEPGTSCNITIGQIPDTCLTTPEKEKRLSRKKSELNFNDNAKKKLEKYALRNKQQIEYFWISPKDCFRQFSSKRGNYKVRITLGTLSAEGNYSSMPNETINSAAKMLLDMIAKENLGGLQTQQNYLIPALGSAEATPITSVKTELEKPSVQSSNDLSSSDNLKYQEFGTNCSSRNTEREPSKHQLPSPCTRKEKGRNISNKVVDYAKSLKIEANDAIKDDNTSEISLNDDFPMPCQTILTKGEESSSCNAIPEETDNLISLPEPSHGGKGQLIRNIREFGLLSYFKGNVLFHKSQIPSQSQKTKHFKFKACIATQKLKNALQLKLSRKLDFAYCAQQISSQETDSVLFISAEKMEETYLRWIEEMEDKISALDEVTQRNVISEGKGKVIAISNNYGLIESENNHVICADFEQLNLEVGSLVHFDGIEDPTGKLDDFWATDVWKSKPPAKRMIKNPRLVEDFFKNIRENLFTEEDSYRAVHMKDEENENFQNTSRKVIFQDVYFQRDYDEKLKSITELSLPGLGHSDQNIGNKDTANECEKETASAKQDIVRTTDEKNVNNKNKIEERFPNERKINNRFLKQVVENENDQSTSRRVIFQDVNVNKINCPHFQEPKFCKNIKTCKRTCELVHTITDEVYTQSNSNFCLPFALDNEKCLSNCHLHHLQFDEASKMITKAFIQKRKSCFKCASLRNQKGQEVKFEQSSCSQTGIKRRICDHFKRGKCRFGFYCNNSHEEPDLRQSKLARLEVKNNIQSIVPDLRERLTLNRASQASDIHRQINDEEEGRKYQCEFCNTKLRTAGLLRRHVKSNHERLKYQCEFCNTKLKTAGLLRRHVKTNHEGLKYQCEFCNMELKTAGLLRRHTKSNHEAAQR